MSYTFYRYIIISILVVYVFPVDAQQIHCYVNPLEDTIVNEVNSGNTNPLSKSITDRLELRKKSLYFHNTLLYMQEPSTLSFPYTDFTFKTYGYQKKPYILNADVQIPIALGGKRFVGKRGWMNAIHVIPWFKVRIFQNDADFPFGPLGDKSLPVRTPSTMPGIVYYGAPASWWDPTNNANKFFENIYVGVKAFHHSNGQDGYELDTVKASNDGEVNLYNGNFGENLYFEILVGGKTEFIPNNIWGASINERKLRKNKPGKQVYLRRHRQTYFYWRVGYEFHPQSLSNEIFDYYSIYGRYRLNLNAGYSILPTFWEFIGDGNKWCDVTREEPFEHWRFTFNLNYILDSDYMHGNVNQLVKVPAFDAKRLNVWLTSYWILRSSNSTALFTQVGWYGSDNYNIYFNQSMFQIRGGLAFAFFDMPSKPDKH